MSDQLHYPLNADTLRRLYAYAMTLCQDKAAAEDLLQSSIEKFLQHYQADRIKEPSEKYVRTMIRNRFIDQYRYQQRHQNDSYEEQAGYDISPLNLEQGVINQETLNQAWSTFSAQDRDILYHWAVLGHSTDEVCQILDMPRGTLLSRIHRLRKQCIHKFADN